MLNKLPQIQEMLVPSCATANKAVEFINDYIDKTSCETLNVDISFMNIIDSCYVSTLCSTKHFTKYPTGKINWKVSSNIVKEFNKDLELGNCYYTV